MWSFSKVSTFYETIKFKISGKERWKMAYLEQIEKQPEITYYQLKDNDDSLVERYVISTPETRKICNVPELVGVEYTNQMLKAMAAPAVHTPISLVRLQTDFELSVRMYQQDASDGD